MTFINHLDWQKEAMTKLLDNGFVETDFQDHTRGRKFLLKDDLKYTNIHAVVDSYPGVTMTLEYKYKGLTFTKVIVLEYFDMLFDNFKKFVNLSESNLVYFEATEKEAMQKDFKSKFSE
jgi:hypothetical protein